MEVQDIKEFATCNSYTAGGAALTASERGMFGTVEANHVVNDVVYSINLFAMNIAPVKTLVEVNSFAPDYPGVYNSVVVTFADQREALSEDATSITEHGKIDFAISTNQLSIHDKPWAEAIAKDFAFDNSDLRKLVDLTISFNPAVKLGQLMLLHQPERIGASLLKLRVLRFQHDTQTWQTTVLGREIK